LISRNSGFLTVDKLSLEFTETVWKDTVNKCTDLGELKTIAHALIKSHFTAREMIGHLLLESLKH